MRGVLAFFVIAIHLAPLCCSDEYTSVFINSIARISVPLFFAISGFLSYDRINSLNFSEYTFKSFKAILIPYIAITVLGFFLLNIFSAALGGLTFIGFNFPLNPIEAIDFFLGLSGYPGLFHLWFLRNLFIAMVLVYFIRINCGLHVTWLMFVFSVILWGLSVFPSKQLSLLIEALSSFSAGYYLSRAIKLSPPKLHSIISCIFLISSAELILFLFGLQSFYRSFCVIFLMIFCCIFYWLYDYSGCKTSRLSQLASTHSFSIYLFHLPFAFLALLFLKSSSPLGLPTILAVTATVFTSTLLTSIFIKKLFPPVYNLLTGKI